MLKAAIIKESLKIPEGNKSTVSINKTKNEINCRPSI